MSIRLDTARERWLRERRYAPSTKATYRDTLRALERRIPGVYLEHVTTDELVSFLLYDNNGKPTVRSGNTLCRQRSTLCSFFGWARRQQLIKTDPAQDLLELNLGKDNRRPGKWLTHEERLQALQAVRACPYDNRWRDEALIVVALLTGLRRAELAGLTWGQVDLPSGRLVVQGKGGYVRTIGLPERAGEVVATWLRFVKQRRGRHPSPTDPVFCTGRQCGGIGGSSEAYTFIWHQPLTKWAVYDIVQRYTGAATHDMRRTFCQMLDDKGLPLQAIQAAMRHSSPAVTAMVYLERSPKRALEAVEDLDI